MAKDTVVGCKLPNGLEIEVGGKTITLNGANSTDIIGGHGLTEVPKDFWDAWIDQNREFAPVKAELIFANDTSKKTEDQAEDQADNVSGLEPINPKKPGKGVKPADVDEE